MTESHIGKAKRNNKIPNAMSFLTMEETKQREVFCPTIDMETGPRAHESHVWILSNSYGIKFSGLYMTKLLLLLPDP